MAASVFVRPMHPKTEIMPEANAIQRILAMGWVGQVKMHGHRAQIHVPANPNEETVAYNRQGQPHKKLLPPDVVSEIRRLFAPEKGWNAIDAEWFKDDNKLFVFDFIKKDDVVLSKLNYNERYKLLPRNFISPFIQILPIVTTLEKCLEILASEKPEVEGLVFKSVSSAGFSDTSIVRCRKTSSRPDARK